jgi:hypothetical protein
MRFSTSSGQLREAATNADPARVWWVMQPAGYEERAEEELFSAAFPRQLSPDIRKCASER